MCDCIKKIEEKILQHYPIHNKKKTKEVSATGTFRLKDFRKITYTDFNLELEGQNKKVPIQVAHTFCPFCAEKINND